jgi:hypothetical protein
MKGDYIMFVVALAGILAVPKVFELANRVLEEYVIPAKRAKKGADGETVIIPYEFAVALTTKQRRDLVEMGAFDIIQDGIHLRDLLDKAAKKRAEEEATAAAG